MKTVRCCCCCFLNQSSDTNFDIIVIQHLFVSFSVANSEYYKLLMRNGQDERKDAGVCTLEELDRVTSEHTLKNTV